MSGASRHKPKGARPNSIHKTTVRRGSGKESQKNVKKAPVESRASSGVVRSTVPARFSFKRFFERHQEVAADSLLRLFSQFASSMMTWAVISIAIALPLCLSLMATNLQQFGVGLGDATRLSLYMETGLNSSSIQGVVGALTEHTDVDGVQVITADQALTEFEQASGFGEVLAGLDSNPLPAVILVSPVSADPVVTGRLLTYASELNGVASAELDLEWVRRLNSILALVERMSIGVSILLGLGVVLVIGNTIRLAIENRREEIVVVKLVGGTNAYVSRPFLYTGLWYGVGGGTLACCLVVISLMFMQGPVSNLAGLYGGSFKLNGLGSSGVLLVLSISGLLGWLGAWIAVLRHLRAIEPG